MAAAFFLAHATGNHAILQAAARDGTLPGTSGLTALRSQASAFDDEPFDPVAVADGSAGWFPSVYGAGDQIGALNEITPQKDVGGATAHQEQQEQAPKTYNLGEILEPHVPAFGTRKYEQVRVGPTMAPPYTGDNQVNGMEETIDTTYQIATQLDGLPHIGVRNIFYNGFTAGGIDRRQRSRGELSRAGNGEPVRHARHPSRRARRKSEAG